MQNFLITGTDTDAGKTYITCLLLKALITSGIRAMGFKPFSCGDRQDPRAIRDAAGIPDFPLDAINPIYLQNPTCPYAAAMLENRLIHIPSVIDAYHKLTTQFDSVLVEGIGGWQVPISATYMFADFAKVLNLPIILVVGNKLGAINHTLLTLQSIRAQGLTCHGIIFNSTVQEWTPAHITNRSIIEETSGVPILAEIIYEQDEIDLPAHWNLPTTPA